MIFVVRVYNDLGENNIYVGVDVDQAIATYTYADFDFNWTNVWVEVWQDGSLIIDCWAPDEISLKNKLLEIESDL